MRRVVAINRNFPLLRVVGVAATAFFIAGCQSIAGSAVSGPSTAVTTTSSPTIGPVGGSYHLPPEYAEWETAYQLRLQQLAAEHQARGMGSPPTDVSFRRFITTAEYGNVYAVCLTDQGFGAAETFDGGLAADRHPPEQAAAFEEAFFRCEVEYPVHPKYEKPLAPAQIRIVYEYFVNDLTPCLEKHGFHTDPATIPTWETFLASYYGPPPGPWSPYAVVTKSLTSLSEQQWQDINKACPQNASLTQVYPD